MTKVCYEVDRDSVVIHVSRNGEKTICGLKAKEFPYGLVKKEVHCKKCWARFNG